MNLFTPCAQPIPLFNPTIATNVGYILVSRRYTQALPPNNVVTYVPGSAVRVTLGATPGGYPGRAVLRVTCPAAAVMLEQHAQLVQAGIIVAQQNPGPNVSEYLLAAGVVQNHLTVQFTASQPSATAANGGDILLELLLEAGDGYQVGPLASVRLTAVELTLDIDDVPQRAGGPFAAPLGTEAKVTAGGLALWDHLGANRTRLVLRRAVPADFPGTLRVASATPASVDLVDQLAPAFGENTVGSFTILNANVPAFLGTPFYVRSRQPDGNVTVAVTVDGNNVAGDQVRVRSVRAQAEVMTLEFTSDHRGLFGGKLLRPSNVLNLVLNHNGQGHILPAVNQAVASPLGDANANFQKPDWQRAFNGNFDAAVFNLAARSDPISQTKNTPLQVNLGIFINVQPANPNAVITGVRGQSAAGGHLSFLRQNLNDAVPNRTEVRYGCNGVAATANLPDRVQVIEGFNTGINWEMAVTIEGVPEVIPLQQTGPHTIYATFGAPAGETESQNANTFTQTGPQQDVTVGRLDFAVRAVMAERGSVPLFNDGNERHHVDAVFFHVRSLGVDFFLDLRWVPGHVNSTGLNNKPSLHEYLWMAIADHCKAECHNLAAAFIVVCRILGLSNNFGMGHIYPRPRYRTVARDFYQNPQFFGRFDQRYDRPRLDGGAFNANNMESLGFVDQNNNVNNFEGVTRFGETLYAIGEHILGRNNARHENASDYYQDHDWAPAYVTAVTPNRGSLRLVFSRTAGGADVGHVADPYPLARSGRYGVPVIHQRFYWNQCT